MARQDPIQKNRLRWNRNRDDYQRAHGPEPGLFKPSGWLLWTSLAAVVLGCVSSRPSPSDGSRGQVQRGTASWYGAKFHGRTTANGETFDMYKVSAAHRTLPFGTRVRVTNLDNGRTLEVRINDRGPFIRGRILDLSYAAAQELDMVEAGLARVEIRVLSSPLEGASVHGYAVQVGAFRQRDRALHLKGELQPSYPGVEVLNQGDGWYRVRIRGLARRQEAEKIRRRLAEHGFSALVVPDS